MEKQEEMGGRGLTRISVCIPGGRREAVLEEARNCGRSAERRTRLDARRRAIATVGRYAIATRDGGFGGGGNWELGEGLCGRRERCGLTCQPGTQQRPASRNREIDHSPRTE